jgi:hypothetical protein
MEKFNLKELNEVVSKEKYHVEVSNRIEALEDLNAEAEIMNLMGTHGRESFIKISTLAFYPGHVFK